MSRYRSSLAWFALLVFLVSVGCGSGISEDDVAAQVSEYLSEYDGLTLEFSKWFEVDTVTLKDKMVSGDTMVTVCAVTVRPRKDYVAHSSVTINFEHIVGDDAGEAGSPKTHDVRFEFERFESGWKLKGLAR